MHKLFLFLALAPFLIQSLAGQNKSRFIDARRGYEIILPTNVTLEGGSYALSPKSADADTDFVIIKYEGKKILYARFAESYREFQSNEDFRRFAVAVAVEFSQADGPDGSSECKNIDSGFVKQNRFGVPYAEFYLRQFINMSTKDTNFITGPFRYIDISRRAISKRGIPVIMYLDWSKHYQPNSDERKLGAKIINNIKFIQ
jgi:hypothetical protein